jgi:N-acetylglucosaminyldiphosphoundecaprenol N-acetyl-beta-D-mannosaminyltransferase
MGRHMLATGRLRAAGAGRGEAADDPQSRLPAPQLPVLPCAGVPITACEPAAAARLVVDRAAGPLRSGQDVHLCNAYTLAQADRDVVLHALLRRATLNFPDGKSVVWANRLQHRRQRPPTARVYGPDLMRAVFELGRPAGLRHYLLGSTPQVLAALQSQLRHDYPGAHLVGAESPPFRDLTEAERHDQRERIRRSRAQLVWVGLGTPKQDWEAARLAAGLPVVAVAVGAAFDLVAGTKRQAPRWMRHNGLEWCFRLAQEPRRLWRRYLFGNARFGYAVCRRWRRTPWAGRPAWPDPPQQPR